jgi:propanol-preferring alcohol dehydrogenase
MAQGDLDPAVTVIGFEDIPTALDDLAHHRITGRLVARITDGDRI